MNDLAQPAAEHRRRLLWVAGLLIVAHVALAMTIYRTTRAGTQSPSYYAWKSCGAIALCQTPLIALWVATGSPAVRVRAGVGVGLWALMELARHGVASSPEHLLFTTVRLLPSLWGFLALLLCFAIGAWAMRRWRTLGERHVGAGSPSGADVGSLALFAIGLMLLLVAVAWGVERAASSIAPAWTLQFMLLSLGVVLELPGLSGMAAAAFLLGRKRRWVVACLAVLTVLTVCVFAASAYNVTLRPAGTLRAQDVVSVAANHLGALLGAIATASCLRIAGMRLGKDAGTTA